MADRLYKRGKIWWAWYYDGDGKRIAKSTRCLDRRAAEALLREWERAAADPAYAAAHTATVREALERFLIDRTNKGRADGTLDSYRVKAGHLARVLGGDTRLARLNARAADSYIDARLDEGASRHTIHKELVVLRGTLKVAKRRGDFPGDIGAIMPDGFSTGYKPRERFLTGRQAQLLLAELTGDRAARVAFILATGARLSESDRAMRADVSHQLEIVRIRGTKTEGAARAVPLVGASHDLIAHAERYGEGTDGRLFKPWASCRRDLAAACSRASKKEIAARLKTEGREWDALTPAEQQALKNEFEFGPVTPNDLRRTYATWLRQHGVEPHLIGLTLGHRDSRMAERVYGRMPIESLGRTLAERVGDRSAFVANGRGTERSARQMRRLDRSKNAEKTVPRDRIELPTRGFSILCSTN